LPLALLGMRIFFLVLLVNRWIPPRSVTEGVLVFLTFRFQPSSYTRGFISATSNTDEFFGSGLSSDVIQETNLIEAHEMAVTYINPKFNSNENYRIQRSTITSDN
jgi:hypothetical protein